MVTGSITAIIGKLENLWKSDNIANNAIDRGAGGLDIRRPEMMQCHNQFAIAIGGSGAIRGGINRYITGVTSRASSVEVIRPPMITQAMGE